MTFRLDAGQVTLEARWDVPDDPHFVAVLCHPHPLQRGTMTAPLMEAVARSLCMRGFAVLRFNFRGVGASTGSHDFGVGEVDDVAASMEAAAATYPDRPLGLAGWSFGAATALRYQAKARSALPYAGIAPPVASDRRPALPARHELAEAHRTFIVGDRDQFVTVDELTAYAESIGARTEVIDGSDHFFYFREERVAAAVADALTAGE
jgi:alpha/beta superfamily hydrolase